MIWDASSGSKLMTLRAEARRIRSLGFSPNGTLLFATADQGDWALNVWEVAGGRRIAVHRYPDEINIYSMTFIDETRAVVGGHWGDVIGLKISLGHGTSGRLRIIDVRTGSILENLDIGDYIDRVAVSPDRRFIVAVDVEENRLHIIDMNRIQTLKQQAKAVVR